MTESVDFNLVFNCFKSVGLCFLLSLAYLISLHVWKSPHGRDHPSTIKKRFFSVFVMLFISPCVLYLGINKSTLEQHSIYELLGIRTEGLCQAVVMPLFLTMILFLGSISMEVLSGFSKIYIEQAYWTSNLKNLIWIRNTIISPISEEFTYRACMMPLLLECFSPLTAVLINPVFFGLAHLHHFLERVKSMDYTMAWQISAFQCIYTSIFGCYSAYIFLRTGHIISCFIVHAFCNHMGFPNIFAINSFKPRDKFVIISSYIVGVVLWVALLRALTEPSWYYNKEPWIV